MAKTILLADDSPTIRKIVELTFHDSDIRVEPVASGAEAMERLANLAPDLILADVVMPEPTGYEICRSVKSSDRPVPVVLLTGTFEPFDERRAEECGADDHLVKPFESRALIDKVERLLSAPAEDESSGPEREVERALEELAQSSATESEPEPVADLDAPPETAAVEIASAEGADGTPLDSDRLSPQEIDAIARAAVRYITADVVREIAAEVVPQVARSVIRERLGRSDDEDS